MEKKIFVAPNVEIILISGDIISTSSGNTTERDFLKLKWYGFEKGERWEIWNLFV